MRWYVNRSGQPEGPTDEPALVEALRRGEIPPTAQVCAEGAAEWRPSLAHPPFAEASMSPVTARVFEEPEAVAGGAPGG